MMASLITDRDLVRRAWRKMKQGGSPDVELLSIGSYTSGHSGCLGDVTVGTNSTAATFIPLVPVFGVQVTRRGS